MPTHHSPQIAQRKQQKTNFSSWTSFSTTAQVKFNRTMMKVDGSTPFKWNAFCSKYNLLEQTNCDTIYSVAQYQHPRISVANVEIS